MNMVLQLESTMSCRKFSLLWALLIILSCTSVAIRTVNCVILLTCSGRRPGGTQAYSSSTQPESSSEVELRWKPEVSLLTFCSIIINPRCRAPPWKPADTAALARLIRLSFELDRRKNGWVGGSGRRIEAHRKTKCWLASHPRAI